MAAVRAGGMMMVVARAAAGAEASAVLHATDACFAASAGAEGRTHTQHTRNETQRRMMKRFSLRAPKCARAALFL
jgi:hypothetical protein